jgi:hypothetical protein
MTSEIERRHPPILRAFDRTKFPPPPGRTDATLQPCGLFLLTRIFQIPA